MGKKKQKATKRHTHTHTTDELDRNKPKQKQQSEDYENFSFVKDPVLYIKTLLEILVSSLTNLAATCVKYSVPILTLVGVVLVFMMAEGPHSPYKQVITDFVVFVAWWVLLGVASSIGLGSGLHTFVLYLGPHIAKVTIAAYKCNQVPVLVPSRWRFDHFEECGQGEGVGFWSIYSAVGLEAFLWGFGTALGELPPYFFALAASIAGTKNEELQEVLDNQQATDTLSRMKLALFKQVKKNAFITVTLAASIPNPLFDLAGLTCGHLQIPFTVFFAATFIGKAINKVSIQTFFIIFAFSPHLVQSYIEVLAQIWPFLAQKLEASIDAQHAALFANADAAETKEEPLIGQLWNYFITAMILYFVVSFLNSIVKNRLQETRAH